MGGSSSLNQKSQGAGYHVSGFLSEKVGRLKITKEQWEGYLAGLDDGARERAEAGTVFHCDAAHGKQEDGHLDANVCMFIGKAHASDIHPTGCWCGNDVYTQCVGHNLAMDLEVQAPVCWDQNSTVRATSGFAETVTEGSFPQRLCIGT